MGRPNHYARGVALVGRSGPDEVSLCLRLLAAHCLWQAVRDARCRQPRVKRAALEWLDSPVGREIAASFGLRWAHARHRITEADLPSRIKRTYTWGG